MKKEINVSKDKFVFVNNQGKMHDKELVTKPIGYFKDAFNRFKRNKGSIVAAFIIMFLVLFAIVVPFATPYTVSYNDNYYAYSQPEIPLFSDLGLDFMDGCKKVQSPKETYYLHYAMGQETGEHAIKDNEYKIEKVTLPSKQEVDRYVYRLDSVHSTGVVFMNLSILEYEAIQRYQDEHNVQIIYPITTTSLRPKATQDVKNANYWYATDFVAGKTQAKDVTINASTGELKFKNIYKKHSGKDGYFSKMRIEDGEKYDYAEVKQSGNAVEVRVHYYQYYKYYHSEILKDRIKEPVFIFGTDNLGKDIFTCLASGARFSFILAIVVASVNLFVGAIYGAIEGYYGGKIDLIMERFVEILSAVPFMIVITLLKYHMKGSSHLFILFISFFLTGWIGMAGRTRMQFYRFKNQEYVLASRTLGAKDLRIMFKHIFPNALGTLITSCVLVIPGMIFSETSLSYLGIINLSTGSMTSVGTLLANGQAFLTTYPYMVVTPALFISLLMLSFNLFGNGLRDAFNPSLRGSED